MDNSKKGMAFSSYKLKKKALSIKITRTKGIFPEIKVKALQSKTLFYRSLENFTWRGSPIKSRFISTSGYRRLEIQNVKPKVGPEELKRSFSLELKRSFSLELKRSFSLTNISDKGSPISLKYPLMLDSCNKSIHYLSKQDKDFEDFDGGRKYLELGFAQTGLNGKQLKRSFTSSFALMNNGKPSFALLNEGKQIKDKSSNKSQKDFQGLTFTVNHRFIALMLRCGKKSVSYNVFLNAVSKCKGLLDLSISSKRTKQSLVHKSGGRGTIKTVDNGKNKNSQNVLSDHSSNSPPLSSKGIRDFSISSKRTKQSLVHPGGVVTIEKNAGNSAKPSYRSASLFVGMDRGTSNRFRDNLLLFGRNSEDISSSSIPKVKVESSSYNCVDLRSTYTSTHSDSRTKQSLVRETQSTIQQFRVSRRLLSRRLGFAAIKNIKIKNSSTNNFGPATDGSILSFAPVTSVPKVLQNKSLLRRKLERDRVADHSTGSMGAHQILINTIQRDHEQDLGKIPLSPKPRGPKLSSTRLLLKQKGSNAKINRGTYEPERTKIGIDSVNRVSPSVETRKVRIGGASYAVPYVPHNSRQEGLGVRWLIACAFNKRQRSQYPSSLCLAHELIDSFKNEGQSTQKRDQSHQLAAANRAYTRYRWW